MPFDYDAQPSAFYLDVESVGNLDPDAIVQQGISVLQHKLAETIAALKGNEGRDVAMNGVDQDGAQSPDAYEPPEGMDGGFTAYGANGAGGGGQSSVWGGAGGTTPYGATPYGQGYEY